MMEEYVKVVRYGGLRVDPRLVLVLATLLFLGGIVGYFLTGDFLYFVLGLVLADMVAAVPYLMGRKRIDEVEQNLADALRQISAVLRSGATFEVAVREIAVSDYGQLSREFSRMLKEMEGGKSFIAAFESMALRVNSPFLEKVATILSDAIRTGGRVADVLDELSEDVRKMYQIRKERVARTTMQFMFLAVSAAVLGPFLLGVSVGIAKFMVSTGAELVKSGTLSLEEFQEKVNNIAAAEEILTLFVIIESLLSGFMAAQMREGRITMGFVYAPVFLLLAYLSFVGGINTVLSLTGG